MRLVPEPTTVKTMNDETVRSKGITGLVEVVVLNKPEGFASRVFVGARGGDSISPFWCVERVEKVKRSRTPI